ncbi:TraM recognition site of TraD and TraG [Saccharopolyspora shandongensis]|uniref:TraM recognition site of TraD and TraG n=1 Tax=Saccharopolyspora shandongensis TaxID=418495 RepID=A0A1H2T6P7_9PSEU|nr:type IV secretion system DNA-binding domain-containing protein [Saccharopolyspora shandongensis]SDW39447.1 TraM recognition site of TraD and TraG [Saccharopolyspora shandongensis]
MILRRSVVDSLVGELLTDPWGTIQTVLTTVWSWVRSWGFVALPALLVVVVGLWVQHRWWFRRCQDALHDRARVVTILAPPTVDPGGAQAVWSNLVGLLRPMLQRIMRGQPHLAWEFVFDHDGVQIRLWVPGTVPPGMVERAIEAAWPGAHTRSAPASSPLLTEPADGHHHLVTGGVLRLARSEALPIRSEFDTDPIRALLGAPVGLGVHEVACVQILARPVTGRRVKRARRAARHLDAGRSTRMVGRILDLITPGPTTRATNQAGLTKLDPQTSLEFNAQNRAIVAKQRGSQWETIIRYAVATTVPAEVSAAQVARRRQQLRGRAHAIASAFSGFTEHNHYRRHRLRAPLTSMAQRRLRRGDLLSIPELAAVAHLPTDEGLPGLARAGARAVPPPPKTPTEGELIRPVGISDTGHARPVGLQVSDARHHLHILGATGSGKSTILARMILADAEHDRGAVVIDPKGDLITDVLQRLPEHTAEKVVLFDADTRGPVPCLNPLEGPKEAAVDNLVSVFSRVFSSAWGPRTEDILRSACLSLRAASETPTLAKLPDLLTDPATRARHQEKLKDDPTLRGFWNWYEQLSDAARAQSIAPLLNKLRAFLLRSFVVKAIAAGPSTVDLSTVLDGGLCLVRIPKGSLGEDTTRLLGSLIVARVWQATTARAKLPQRQRRDAALYVDEAHNFLNLPYAMEDMLAEARGYRLAMTLAHQHLGQLPRDLKEGISTNARSKIFFNASPEDARELARHTAPRISEHDLAHLGAFHAATRLVVNGEETPPFTVTTQPLPPAIRGRAKTVRQAAARHTRPLASSADRAHDDEPDASGFDPRRAS